METLIPENDDFFPKCNTLTIRTQTVKKSTREKGTQHKDATTSLSLFISRTYLYFLFTLSGFFLRPPYCSLGEKNNTKGL